MPYSVTRYHDISAGHRVVGHEGKCQHLHGHNYRIHFKCAPVDTLDSVGRVVDFSVIKSKLCAWLEKHWDHKFLVWEDDPMRAKIYAADAEGVIYVPFNPTAENMAVWLVEVVGPGELAGTGAELIEVLIEETRKCSATYSKKIL